VAGGEFFNVSLGDVFEREFECVGEFCDVPEDVAEFAGEFRYVEAFARGVMFFEQVADFAGFAGETEKAVDDLVFWVGVIFFRDHGAGLVFVKFHGESLAHIIK